MTNHTSLFGFQAEMTDIVRGSKAPYFFSLDLSTAFKRITESGTAWDLWRSPAPTPLPKARPPTASCPGLRSDRFLIPLRMLPEQPVPVSSHPQGVFVNKLGTYGLEEQRTVMSEADWTEQLVIQETANY